MSVTSRICTVLVAMGALLACPAAAKRVSQQKPIPINPTGARVSLDRPDPYALRSATAAPDTTILGSWTFDDGGSCATQGWMSVDRTTPIDTFFHVDDFAGLDGGDFGRLAPLEGSQSMWCGARPSAMEPYCNYATLPGYGNRWLQTLETPECFVVSGNASVDFLIAWDTEPGYDWVSLELVECDAPYVWQYDRLAGGRNVWDGVFSGFQSVTIHDSVYTDSLRLRIRFESDSVWSDEDGLWSTDGAVILDSLTVRDTTGVILPTETFESEAVGATTTLSGNWTAGTGAAAGDFAALYPGAAVLQEDPCVSNLSCFWGFFSGSANTYACGGHPEQTAVTRPLWNGSETRYLSNEVWSPWMALGGTGNTYELAFDVYRDLALDAMIFYRWFVRFNVGGCPTPWFDDNLVRYGNQKDWFRYTAEFGAFVPPGATDVQVSVGAFDGCQWYYCFGEYCRSHAPLIDNVEVRRIDSNGPAWSVRDIDLFQDNFASDGTLTGTVRADAAIDLLPLSNSAIRPGDSVVVHVGNPEGRLATDPYTGLGAAVYTYVSVRPQGQAGKSGADLTSDPARWPVVDSLVYAGNTWYTIRMDSAITGGSKPDTAFCIDLNDNLFTPGDTIFYAFGAIGDVPAVEATYYSRFTGVTDDIAYALSNPMEFTCLPTQRADVYYPAGGGVAIRPTLYVDFYDGRGAQPDFDAAFAELGIAASIDRYDVLQPTAYDGNSPGGRVVDVAGQLIPAYRRIIWSTGDLKSGVLGTGSYPAKADDAGMLKAFLDLVPGGGVYFTGDDLVEEWNTLAGSAAALRSTYIDHTLASRNHAPTYGVSPLVVGENDGIFDHGNNDQWVAFGGCPSLNDFDVLTPQGAAIAAATYGGGAGAAVIVQETENGVTNPGPVSVRVVLSGFSFHEIENVVSQGQPSTSAHLLWDILMYLDPGVHTGVEDIPTLANSLAQNVPNPFNPATAIEFTVKERGPVTLRVYNVRGQLVTTLVDDNRAPGIVHHVEWDGRNDAGQQVASGVYFYRLVTTGFASTKKMVLLK